MDIQGTKLGEPLFLRIELDGESIFDIFARNLVAQSGIDDEEIQLLDDRGCPTDPVFPGANFFFFCQTAAVATTNRSCNSSCNINSNNNWYYPTTAASTAIAISL